MGRTSSPEWNTGLSCQDAVDEAYLQAADSSDSNRATLLVDEMQRRHEWTMNPQVSSWSTGVSSLAFIWYLGATPAAAMVNVSQTTLNGVPMLKAAFPKATLGGIARHMARAGRDFIDGRGDSTKSKRLSGEERPRCARPMLGAPSTRRRPMTSPAWPKPAWSIAGAARR